ncbi:MAG: leucine-rich repeat domain-containing protein, partial [Ruminococcaceae bacterium]|nr:leucine-rich repeat domain-containing protein [Oscillospiraceae bacterium]
MLDCHLMWYFSCKWLFKYKIILKRRFEMKKKIFLIIAMVALLVCVFAISVSAANEVTLVGGEKVDFETVFKVGKSGGVDNVVTGFNTGYNKNSMTDVIFPDYLAGIECNGLFGKYANPASTTIRTLTFKATDEFFISGDNIFTGISVAKVTFNPNCVVEIRKGSFSGCTSLTEITFPKFRKLASNAFASCSNMVPTNELVFAEGMTEIGADAFHNCSSLSGTIVFPSTLTTIKEEAFNGTSITGVDFSRCVDLVNLDKAIFDNCDSLTTIDMSACVDLTSLGNSFAENCDELTQVILPPNLEKINEKGFAWCCKLQSMVIPASCTLIGVEAFQYARRGQELQVFTLYIQSNVNFDTSRYSVFNSSSAKVEFVLIGENITAESFIANNSYTHVTGATIVDYVAGENPWTYVPGQTISSHTIVTNYCRALALMGEHNSEDNPCVINCSVCGKTSLKENPQHTVSITVNYESGYDKTGIKLTSCTNPGCGYEEASSVEAIFVCLGYSAPENGEGSIAIGFTVNYKAIEKYEAITGKTLKYGVFTVLQSKLGDNDVFGEDGTAASGVLSADITHSKLKAFELKV